MPESDLSLLINAAEEAARIATRFWRKSPKTWEKPGLGPVSEADYEIDDMLRSTLCGARPDYGWLSEETEDSPARLSARRLFIVDPLDGTRAYLNGERTFAHSLAVVEDGKVVTGVVMLPLREKLYTATLGGGAFFNGTPIKVAQCGGIDGATLLTPRRVMTPDYWRGEVPKAKAHLRPSLAYRLCLVAEGRYDAMLTTHSTWQWDIAAGALILAEAGGTFTDTFGKEIKYNTEHPASHGTVAGCKTVHHDIIHRLA
ncbi:3'(2'),5'-bisphosphate nucleotidase CysQ [Actibacterium lipolyticum]|uniref:Inositol-1-monophosphatase n=1 Tax=Actibacterium lipolyticum TaxID=1524263 RepID=A0A238KUU1_9RHOB|nr:3'(2'),5'-bisphosphate nucleotidase CysQ [Actibacterium lipolyticum]SMX46371.1 Inositol-1-monophosphatase [Actibacterium lipolyticum]